MLLAAALLSSIAFRLADGCTPLTGSGGLPPACQIKGCRGSPVSRRDRQVDFSSCGGVSLSQGGADPAPPAMLVHTASFGCSLQVPSGHILHGQHSRQWQVIIPVNTILPVIIFAAVGGHRRSWKCKRISRSPPPPVTAVTKCYLEHSSSPCPSVGLLLVMSWPALRPWSHAQATLMSIKAHGLQRV